MSALYNIRALSGRLRGPRGVILVRGIVLVGGVRRFGELESGSAKFVLYRFISGIIRFII